MIKALDVDLTQESTVLTIVTLCCFDYKFRIKFEYSRANSQAFPNIIEFLNFIGTECNELEASNHQACSTIQPVESSSSKPNVKISSDRQGASCFKPQYSKPSTQPQTVLITKPTESECFFCKRVDHKTNKYWEFMKLTPESLNPNDYC